MYGSLMLKLTDKFFISNEIVFTFTVTETNKSCVLHLPVLIIQCYSVYVLFYCRVMSIAKSSRNRDQLLLKDFRFSSVNQSQII